MSADLPVMLVSGIPVDPTQYSYANSHNCSYLTGVFLNLFFTRLFTELFARITGIRQLWGRRQGISKMWLGTLPYVLVSDAAKCETIMGSPKHIDKSRDYDFLQPWLGTGLLTSQGRKWHSRRKILTPAFHFKILDDFIDVFQEQSAIMVNRLASEVGKAEFNIFPYVTLCTLDIICGKVYTQHTVKNTVNGKH